MADTNEQDMGVPPSGSGAREPNPQAVSALRASPPNALEFIEWVAKVSEAVGWQAGVGGMETAGSIISYLAKHPDKLDAFMREGFFALPLGFHERGCLTWHGMNGKIVAPEFARRARQIKALEKGNAQGTSPREGRDA